MNTVRCQLCKQMFSFDGLPPDSCPDCKRLKDIQFQSVREIVKDNPGITALEVHGRTDIPLPTIVRYIESGMLEIMSTKENLDNVDLQIWIDKSTNKGKKAKTAAAAAVEKPVEVIFEEEQTKETKKKKTEIKFIVK
ncbi:MAG: hypothetical protein FWE90_07320 [Defluviitaleaceae bacterium]|nr:hypothetical protein [Defluviitaleaceae bacterium]